MRSRSRLRGNAILCFCFFGLLASCSGSTQIALDPGASLRDYRAFVVEPASNDTGQNYSFDIASFFTDELKSSLQAKGYEIVEPGENATSLVVKSSITSYSSGNAGKKAAAVVLGLVPGGYFMTPTDAVKVKAILTDERTGKTMADIVSNQSAAEGLTPAIMPGMGHGISIISPEKLVLREAAWGLASKIDDKIKQ
jgi:hypothetical protein